MNRPLQWYSVTIEKLSLQSTNQIKGNKVIAVGVSIGDFPVEISVMSQNKNLL